MSVRIFVEGGSFGTEGGHSLNSECRRGFSEFFRNAGLQGKMPRTVACGPRSNAFKQFRAAISRAGGEFPILLVDSESQVANGATAWRHLKDRDGWDKPSEANDDRAHLMVQCMESWIVADSGNLAKFYGQGFRSEALPNPPRGEIEGVAKEDICGSLERATAQSNSGQYHKGRHSFKLLATTDPELVTQASPFARRLIETLQRVASRP